MDVFWAKRRGGRGNRDAPFRRTSGEEKRQGRGGGATRPPQALVEEAGAVRGRVRVKHQERRGWPGGGGDEEEDARPGGSLCEDR